jgi:hypothetical protein
MATPFHDNWACTRIRKAILKKDATPEEVAKLLMTHPKVLAIIQEEIDHMAEVDYDPHMPGGDPAEHIVGELSRALVYYPGSEDDFQG